MLKRRHATSTVVPTLTELDNNPLSNAALPQPVGAVGDNRIGTLRSIEIIENALHFGGEIDPVTDLFAKCPLAQRRYDCGRSVWQLQKPAGELVPRRQGARKLWYWLKRLTAIWVKKQRSNRQRSWVR